MIGNVIAPFAGVYIPPDPDDYFDPTTHTATEADFIRFLEAGGKYDDNSLIGYKVILSNTVNYNNGLWVIADVNHDSSNTGQTNCYDLISQECFNPMAWGGTHDWRASSLRTWLNNTFYPGFSSDFKSHILNPKYNSQGSWYTDDYIILPSRVETNVGKNSFTDDEGIPYPIFTDNSSRIKYSGGTARYWWTRSRDTGTAAYSWSIINDGSVTNSNYNGNLRLAPILRVS